MITSSLIPRRFRWDIWLHFRRWLWLHCGVVLGLYARLCSGRLGLLCRLNLFPGLVPVTGGEWVAHAAGLAPVATHAIASLIELAKMTERSTEPWMPGTWPHMVYCAKSAFGHSLS